MSSRIASFETTYTTSVDDGGIKSHEDIYRVLVNEVQAPASENIAVYHWDFTYIDDSFDIIVTEIASATITKMQVAFKYNQNQDAVKLSIFKYGTGDPKFQNGTQILADVSSTELATADILSTNQTGLTITLDDLDNLYYQTQLDMAARLGVTVTLHRHEDQDTSSGSVELSGKNLFGGNTDWRDAASGEPVDPPLLIITYDVTSEAHPVLNMKYTTSTPATDQTSPVSSIGKYIAPNDVFPSADIASSISSTQTTVPISGTLPTVTGLASVGPEIFKYNTIDSINNQLAGVTRGIAPLASFPAGFDSFKIAEKVYYLNDLNLLFDTRPSSGLVQYRCVAISNTDTGDDFNIQNAVIGIAQDSTANVQLRIGVEFPKFDARFGGATDGDQNTSTDLLVAAIEEADGFFDGAVVKFLDPVDYAIVDSYVFDTSSSTGEFSLDRDVTGPDLDSGRGFVILPAPAQQLANDASAPTSNSGRFTGFEEDVEGIDISLVEHGSTMQENDLFYVWIRRTLTKNVEKTNDTGAVLIFRYRDTT